MATLPHLTTIHPIISLLLCQHRQAIRINTLHNKGHQLQQAPVTPKWHPLLTTRRHRPLPTIHLTHSIHNSSPIDIHLLNNTVEVILSSTKAGVGAATREAVATKEIIPEEEDNLITEVIITTITEVGIIIIVVAINNKTIINTAAIIEVDLKVDKIIKIRARKALIRHHLL